MRAIPAAAALLLLAGCGARTPPLPEVSPDDFPPTARVKVRQTLDALEAAPEDPGANGRLGMFLQAHDRPRQAVACYRRAASFAPEDPRWLYLQGAALAADGDLQGAVDAWNASLAIAPAGPTLIQLGNAFSSLGRVGDSRRCFEDALQFNPNSPAALYGIARLLSEAGNYTEAIPLLRKAIALAPRAGAVHYELGVAQRESGDAQSALVSFANAERFQRTQPPLDDPVLDEVNMLRRDPRWLLEEGRRLEGIGDIQQAAALYQEAVDQDPNFALAHSSLVSALGLLGRYDDAEKHYRWALQVAPGLEELHYNWGIVEAERGHTESAAESFRSALQINPNSADGHFNLGSMLADEGLDEEAVREFEIALELNPSHRLALFQLAHRRVEAGQIQEGIDMLQRALEVVDAKTPGILYALADAYARAGDNEKAILCAQQALELAREFGDDQMAASLENDLRGLRAAQAAER
jgi:tetratricopeptide (TPR) repeat protein